MPQLTWCDTCMRLSRRCRQLLLVVKDSSPKIYQAGGGGWMNLMAQAPESYPLSAIRYPLSATRYLPTR